MFLHALHITSLFVLLLYLALILFYRYHWIKTPEDKILVSNPDFFISVIIIGRNESTNLMKCIKSILANDYSKSSFEIIYVDDHSTDDSLQLLESIKHENFRYLELKDFVGEKKINNYKKKAIEIAVSKAKGDIILQTDADTVAGKKWLLSHANKYQNQQIKFVTAPVFIISDKSPVEQFQRYDFMTTMGVTCAGISSKLHYMANGANMSFRKNAFATPDTEYASGDDMFLVQDIANKYPDSIGFIKNKESVVYTFPEKTLRELIKQRLRWATKTKGYDSPRLKFVIALIFFTNLLILLNIVMIFIFGWYQVYFTLFIVVVKLIIDMGFIKSIGHFFNEKIEYRFLIPALLRYPLYIVYVGLLSLVKTKYQWKSRIVK